MSANRRLAIKAKVFMTGSKILIRLIPGSARHYGPGVRWLIQNWQQMVHCRLRKFSETAVIISFIIRQPCMETGWDILFFWVARMILATTYVTGQVPFKTVYLHGMIRAEDGKKMSKSRPESIVDPLSVIPVYGADSLRLALIMGVSPGNEQNWGTAKAESNRNFLQQAMEYRPFYRGSTSELAGGHKTSTKNGGRPLDS